MILGRRETHVRRTHRMSGDAELFYIEFHTKIYPFNTHTFIHTKVWIFFESVGCTGTNGPLSDILAITTMKMVSFMVLKIFLLKINPLSLASAKRMLCCVFPKLPNIYNTHLLATLVFSLVMRS